MFKLSDLETFKQFRYEKVLAEDPATHTLALLGTFPSSEDVSLRVPSIIRIEKTAILPKDAVIDGLSTTLLQTVKLIGSTDIYSWLSGWLTHQEDIPDVKIHVISPATEAHIEKYSTQRVYMVHETPELYKTIVKPFINQFPPARTQWVEDILTGKSEVDKVLHRDPSPTAGYVLLPDMKWDQTTVSTLYLLAIALSKDIKSLRDIRKDHLPMLRSIRREASRVVGEKWGLEAGSLRFYVHYQPSYYHFHVHVVNVNYVGLMGMNVGQAHLLDDIISLLEVDTDSGPSIFERMTFTYGLGERHGLFEKMRAAQSDSA